MFNPGDMVIYKGRLHVDMNGSTGEVLCVHPGYEHNKRAYTVRWQTGRLKGYGDYGVWAENLDPAMYKYDPEQAGDTEEDI